MATTTTTSTNTGGIANSLNTPARADEDGGRSESFSEDERDDDVSVDCGTIGSSYDEEYIQVYRESILVGGSFFPPDNSESGSGRWEWNGMLLDISSLFPATKSETDSSSLFSRSNSNSNSIMAIYPPHRSTDGSENDEIIIARNPSISSYFPAYFSDTASSVSNETRLDRAYSAIQHAMSSPEKDCVMQLLNFDEAVAIGRRSPEKLFRILNIYDVMAEAMVRLGVLVTDDVVINEARDVLSRLSVAACGTFAEFGNAIQSEILKKPMQSGESYPLTRNVMYYVKLIVDYSETLNLLLEIREDERGPSLDNITSVDLINPKAVDELREIATAMIRSGFKKECIQFYSTVRSDTLDECLVILGIEKLSIEEVQKIEWNSLNEKMKKWIQAVKIVVRLILSNEKSLCDQIFCGADETKEICFNETMKGCVMQLLNFGKAVAIGRRSHEKLFRILDMYDVMAEVMARLEVLVTDYVVINEARDVFSNLL